MTLRALAALAAAALLQGCFLAPGVFDSSLDLRRDDSFAFAYKGEIVFSLPDEADRDIGAWSDAQAYCADEKKAEASVRQPRPSGNEVTAVDVSRPCSPAEIAEQKKSWENARASNAKSQAEERQRFAQMFGYTPGDDEANRRLAAQIAKIEGFRTVIYGGKGVFTVDYAKAGRLDHDFVFPTLIQANVIFPFVIARLQKDAAVRVAAPGFGGAGSLGALARMSGGGSGRDMSKLSARTKGRFTLTTDGEILTNNTDDGPTAVPNGKRLVWDIDPRTAVPPEALVKLR